MISRRDKLLNFPWEQQRYEQHRQKVRSAKPAIDVRTPPTYTHVIRKAKKIQTEKERSDRIEKENVRLLQRLGDIMKTKRIENLWVEPRPNFLHREKLFEVDSRSTLPKWVAVNVPKAESNIKINTLKAPAAKTARRCPTCTGNPEITRVLIPEKRIPWQLDVVSWHRKSSKESKPKYCLHCGHIKL